MLALVGHQIAHFFISNEDAKAALPGLVAVFLEVGTRGEAWKPEELAAFRAV